MTAVYLSYRSPTGAPVTIECHNEQAALNEVKMRALIAPNWVIWGTPGVSRYNEQKGVA